MCDLKPITCTRVQTSFHYLRVVWEAKMKLAEVVVEEVREGASVLMKTVMRPTCAVLVGVTEEVMAVVLQPSRHHRSPDLPHH